MLAVKTRYDVSQLAQIPVLLYESGNCIDSSFFILQDSSNRFAIKGKTARTRVYKNHLKMVKYVGLTQDRAKGIIKMDSPKTLGTRVSCKTGRGLGGQGARQT